MNYYEHHLGDYLRDTAHLSMIEDGAYRRLIDAYYIREAALPLEMRDLFRLVRAASKQDREAVETVLREFFTETPDGWIHGRCDREIARFQDKQRKAKASAEARWSQRQPQSEGNANASPDAMRTHSEGNAPRARPQTPDTRHQPSDVEHPQGERRASAPPRPDDVKPQTWADFLTLRRAKKAPVTETVIAGARREAEKARLSLEAFLSIWCARGSQGLQADWIKPEERGKAASGIDDIFAGAK